MITIVTVHECAARLPNGEGTRNDICELLRDSQFLAAGVTDNQVYSLLITILTSRWRSVVVRPPVLPGKLSLSCARLTAGCVTTLWVKHPLSVNQHGQLSQPSFWGRLNE